VVGIQTVEFDVESLRSSLRRMDDSELLDSDNQQNTCARFMRPAGNRHRKSLSSSFKKHALNGVADFRRCLSPTQFSSKLSSSSALS
jgi:hypothetical protein